MGVTHIRAYKKNFNPRSREGSDDFADSLCFEDLRISIHAPARGATPSGCLFQKIKGDFNPRSREGSDVSYLIQSGILMDFNPRSREGSDDNNRSVYRSCIRFQSTLPRGERLNVSFVMGVPLQISIHAPARGATQIPKDPEKIRQDFNPRSREGSDM